LGKNPPNQAGKKGFGRGKRASEEARALVILTRAFLLTEDLGM